MAYILGVFFFALGAAVGSFLNVAALRYNTGLSLGGRSRCFSCGQALSWRELIPIASFLLQRGRCRACRSALSWQYPLGEAATGLLFLAVGYKFNLLQPAFLAAGGFGFAVFYWVVFGLLIVVSIYDFRHKIIPNGLVYAFILLALGRLFALFQITELWQFPALWHLLAGPALALPFFLLWLLSRGRWMGLGDAKLALGIGWLMGIRQSVSVFLLSFWIGAGTSLIILAIGALARKLPAGKTGLSSGAERLTMKSEIPFAPFLVIAAALVFFFELNLLDLNWLP
jgi:prepilin signal peptidase PulO-like enzyme (type II secretory pathway)